VFHAAAVERGLIPADGVPTDKTSVRDYLRAQDRDADFTALQGYVYGPGMKHVRLYPGAAAALARLQAAGVELFIVSHKTPTPFAGPPYDLHQHARDFLGAVGLMAGGGARFAPEQVFFEITKEEKAARVSALGCDVFIDDLPEILAMEGYPAAVRKLLFDPQGHHPAAPFERFADWTVLADALLATAA
jgi:hypothetical protein